MLMNVTLIDRTYRYITSLFSLQKTLSGHKNIIRYVDSSISMAPNKVYEVMLLMQYCRGEFNPELHFAYKDFYMYLLILFNKL